MTEREELVERVRAMVVSKDPHISYENAGDIARAAIAECEKDRAGQTAEEMIANVREIIGEMAWGVGLPSPFVMLEPILPMSENALAQVTTKQIALRKEQIEPIFGAIYSRLLKDGPPDFVGKERERANKLEAQCAATRAALEFYADPYEFQLKLGRAPEGEKSVGWEQVPDFYDECDFGSRAHDALSPDAGRKVLDVVRITKEIVEFCDDPKGSENPETLAMGLARILPRARKALSAIGWKP